MKKRFLVNDDAASLWNEFEDSESIKVVGGVSPVVANEDNNLSSATNIDKDHTVTIWSKSF
ncbi:hypothetical protein [Prevotella sp. P3-122]|uniref:hypothetical protein n=1 Tax=Prevotella sp. P3-122 TaxID=2024223 RepID=UPI000B9605E5|nr:hypothetical protein [Prevotella sp. P3-122]OYP59323.1 hypothetical protein CIL02_11700 [Prevotella sp. P3-122]